MKKYLKLWYGKREDEGLKWSAIFEALAPCILPSVIDFLCLSSITAHGISRRAPNVSTHLVRYHHTTRTYFRGFLHDSFLHENNPALIFPAINRAKCPSSGRHILLQVIGPLTFNFSPGPSKPKSRLLVRVAAHFISSDMFDFFHTGVRQTFHPET